MKPHLEKFPALKKNNNIKVRMFFELLPWSLLNWLFTLVGQHQFELILNTDVLTLLLTLELVIVAQTSSVVELITDSSLRVVAISWIVTFTWSWYYG